ncbi:MAG: glutathione peroxidase [bacterium]
MSIFDYSFKDTRGQEIFMSQYKGKVLLIANTASKCGFAGQFVELESLHKKFEGQGLVVIGFPCDQFLGQEPETNETIVKTCFLSFGVTFMLSEKINVNGKNAHPLFTYLKHKLPAGLLGETVKWNFTKFLIDKDGSPYKRYEPTTAPLSMEDEIIKLLTKKSDKA